MSKFNRVTVARVVLTLAIVLAASFGVGRVLTVQAQDPTPQTVGGWASYLLYSGNGVTAGANGTGKVTADYGVGDCYSIVDATLNQTVTVALQSSPDNSNWNTTYTYAATSADSVTFTRTTMYGQYTRATTTLGTANPVTVTVRCIAKDN